MNKSDSPVYNVGDMRQSKREPLMSTIDCSVKMPGFQKSRLSSLKCMTVDISERGIGIETDYPLAPGHTLWLNSSAELAGTVRWCMPAERKYRAGIEISPAIIDFPVELARQQAARLFNQRTEDYIIKLNELEERASAPHDTETLMNDITRINDVMLERCLEFEKNFPPDAVQLKEARTAFRLKTNPVLAKGNFINHARIWPKGHPGDYMILEQAYRNTPMSEGIGYYLDKYCLSATLCTAVRGRKALLREFLQAELGNRSRPSILDVACGSCREIFEISPDIEQSGAKITCIDFDSEALDFAANRISYAGISDQLEFRKYNAFKMVNHERNIKEFGMQDVIYSVGFFDYIEDETLVRMLGSLYKLLNPGGTLITSFKDCRRYATSFYHWMVDWSAFYQRTEEDCRRLLERVGIPFEKIYFKRDRSGVIMFFNATR